MDAAVNNGEIENGIRGKGSIKEALILLLASTVLYQLGLSVLVYIAPLMTYAVKHGKLKAALLMLVELLVISGIELIKGGVPEIGNTQSLISFALCLYFPLSLSAAGIVWLYASGKRVVQRIVLSLIPFVVISAIYIVPFAVDRALLAETYSLYNDAFASLVGPIMEPLVGEFDWSIMFTTVMLTIFSILLPTMAVAVCATCFIYETAKHSKESGWEERVRRFSFGSNAIWFLIGAWALVLLNYFISTPAYVPVILLNIALTSVVLFACEGFSVLYVNVWKKRHEVKSMQLFLVLVIIAMLIPGLNILIIFGLPLMGVLESFFDMKKIGVTNEDYS